MRSTLTSRGQTSVPAEIRRRFKLTDRSRLEWMVEGDAITVLPVAGDPVRTFRGALKGRYSTKALLADRQRDRAREQRRG